MLSSMITAGTVSARSRIPARPQRAAAPGSAGSRQAQPSRKGPTLPESVPPGGVDQAADVHGDDTAVDDFQDLG